MACPAAGKPLGHARAIGQIHIEVEEEEALAFPVPLEIKLRQPVILGINLRQHILRQGIRRILQHHRLHGKDVKAGICHSLHILGKIKVAGRIGATHVIIIIIP